MQQEIRRSRSIEVVHGAPTKLGEFLAWAARRPREEGRYELANGVVTRMTINVTRNHWIIASNLLGLLHSLIDRDRYIAGGADFGVRTDRGARFPDVLVVPVGGAGGDLAADDPILLAEVLSPSSNGLDFTTKLREYTGIASLREYMICSQDSVRVWLWLRRADGSWPEDPDTIEGRDAKVPVAGLGAELDMAVI